MSDLKKYKATPVTARAKQSLRVESPAPFKQTSEGKKSWFNKAGHFALDVAGLVPGYGEFADGANAAWYAAEGDYTNAALSTAAMIPFAGWGAAATKFGMKGTKMLKVAKKVDKIANSKIGKFAQLNKPHKLGKYDRMGTTAVDYVLGSEDSSEPKANSGFAEPDYMTPKRGGAGGNLSKLIKTRNSTKKGSAEYAKAQNAINKAYGSKKRH